MSTDPFTDEILSAIIDGEADDETVAAVAADPDATARLEQLRSAVRLVATPVPDATPQRRSASIAAAMAAATPAPEVTSLAAARHERAAEPTPRQRSVPRGRWLAAVAAAVLLVVAIPLLTRLGDDQETADTASSSLDAGADTSTDDTDDAAPTLGDEAVSDDAMADDAMEEEPQAATNDAEEAEDTAGESGDADVAMDEAVDDSESTDDAADDAPAEDTAQSRTIERLESAPTIDSIDNVNEFIELGVIAPQLALDDVADTVLSPECADSLRASTPPEVVEVLAFDLAFLDEDGVSEPRLLVIRFNDDETSTTLDAEDCAELG